MSALTAAMRLLEEGRFGPAAEALRPLAGAGRDGVIARFRLAESLSRLGRHDEAVDEASRAHADAPDLPSTGLWFAQTLAEAGRLDEAAAVRHPEKQREFVSPVATGYAALARLPVAEGGARAELAAQILESRHGPLYSLALRLTERRRLAKEPRWPDLPSFAYRNECRTEMREDGVTEHPAPPKIDASGPFGWLLRRIRVSAGLRWMQFHASCDDWRTLVTDLRAAQPDSEAVAEAELEMLLALGRLDEADTLADRLAREAGADAAGELAIDRCRLAQLRGRAARPGEFEGFRDAERRHGDSIAWLECCAALLDGRDVDARAAADRVSDPSHREYVEAALLRWAETPSA